MKQSKTTLKELTAAYRAVLRHGILCNAIALGLIVATPALADPANTSGNAFVFGDVAISEQHTIDKTAFGGRRMEWNDVVQDSDTGLWTIVEQGQGDNKYRNEFPNYQMVGRSFELSDSVAYVGPVTLTLRELDNNDHLAYNWAGDGEHAGVAAGVDVDIAAAAGVDFGNTPAEIYGAVANLIGDANASYTAEGVIAFANRDDSKTAGSFSFDAVNAVIDGATLNANSINIANGSTLRFVNSDPSSLVGATNWYTNPGDISSTGVTTLNANTVNIDHSRMVIDSNAELVVNANRGATFSNSTSTSDGGAIYNNGTFSVDNVEFTDNTGRYGGALLNNGTATINGGTFSGNQTGAQGYGGAIFNNFGLLTLNGVTFSDNNADWDGGAISSATPYFNANNKPADFEGDVINEETIRAYWQTKTGFDAKNKMVIVNSTFDNNTVNVYSGGALGVYSDAIIHQSHFTNNNAGGNDPADVTDGGGAIYAGGWARLEITGSDFSGNSSNYGGAIATTRGGRENGAYMDITSSVFDNNTATVAGGAISNAFDNAILTNVTFTNNTAAQMGGAIYNTGGMTIAAMDKDVDFYGNTANGVDNDIYNAGSLTLHAGSNQLISLAGGIDGLNGTLDIVGDGLVDISNSLNNQTVNVAGQLHLSDPMTLEGTTITVAESALLNTLDNTINNYSSHAFLGNNSNVMVDVSSDGIDTFNIASGKHAHVEAFTMLSDLAGDSAVRHLADYGSISVNSDFHAYTTESMYSLAGNSMNDGTVTITKAGAGTGGLFAAINGTTDEDYQGMYYSLTGNDTSVDSGTTLRNAEIDVLGAGTGDGDYGIALNGHIVVDGQSSFVTHNAKIEGNGSIENSEGGEIEFNNSKIGVEVNNEGIVGIVDSTLAAGSTFENRVGATTVVFDSVIDAEVVNYGRWISDPSTYSGIVHNYSTASFDNDTFTSTAELENMGTADLKNGVTFANGAEITSTGVINLVDGTTHFNNTASSNTINLLNGADFDGVLTGTGILNMSNGAIDTVTGGVAGGGLIVDANLTGTGTIDTLTGGTTGAKIKTINVLNSEYGTAGSLGLNIGGATLDDDLQINGMNYYTNVAVDGENLVLSDKLMNTSGLHAQLGSWDGEIIGTSTEYDTETNSYSSTAGMTVGGALTALETAVNGKQNTIVNSATIVANGTGGFDVAAGSIGATHLAANSVASSNIIDGTIVNADIAAGTITTDRLKSSNVSQFTNDAGYQNATQVSDAITAALANGENAYQTASDVATTLGAYSTTDQMNTAISNALANGENAYQTASDVTATLSAYSTTSQMNEAIANNAQNATYTSGTHADGTIGKALDNLNEVTVANRAKIEELIGNGANSIGGQIAAATTMAGDDDPESSLYSNFAEGASVTEAVTSLDNAIGTTITDGHVAADNTVGQNLNSLNTALVAVESNIGTTSNGTHVTATDSVGTNINSLDAALATAEGNIASNTTAIGTLNGDEDTAGSVRNIAKGYFDLAAQNDALTLSAANAYTDKRIEKLDQDLSAGIASAVALSSVAVSDVRRGELSVGAGYGYFNGQSAGAFGAAMGISNRWSVNAGAGISGYDVSFRAGTNYKFKVF